MWQRDHIYSIDEKNRLRDEALGTELELLPSGFTVLTTLPYCLWPDGLAMSNFRFHLIRCTFIKSFTLPAKVWIWNKHRLMCSVLGSLLPLFWEVLKFFRRWDLVLEEVDYWMCDLKVMPGPHPVPSLLPAFCLPLGEQLILYRALLPWCQELWIRLSKTVK